MPQPSNIAATRGLPARPNASRARLGIRRAGLAVAIGGLLMGIFVGIDLWLTWVRFRPRVAALAESVPRTTAYMKRRIDEGHPPRRQRWATLDSLPTLLVCAVVAAEDKEFFVHGTLDWNNQRGAARRALRGDLSRGGSGIAQQLARNLFLSPDRTPRRKLREYLLAYQISHALSKERQLEIYINVVEWGDGVWGIAAGSQHLFGREAADLTPSEMILLANVLPAPSRRLALPISAPRRKKLERIAGDLWQEGLLDDLARTSTIARLERMGAFVDSGMAPAAAIEAVKREMGPERPANADAIAEPVPVGRRCDPRRRISPGMLGADHAVQRRIPQVGFPPVTAGPSVAAPRKRRSCSP